MFVKPILDLLGDLLLRFRIFLGTRDISTKESSAPKSLTGALKKVSHDEGHDVIMQDRGRSESSSSEDDSSSEPEESRQSVQHEVEDSISQLLDLSVLLRKQGAQQHEDRAADFVPVEENGDSMVDEFMRWSERACRKSAENPRNYCVEEWMVARMQRTMLRRWRLMCYREHHANRIAASRMVRFSGSEPEVAVPKAPDSNILADKAPAPTRSHDAHTIVTVRTKQSSAATELPAGFRPPSPGKRPRSSIASSKSHFTPGRHDFPRAPKVGENSKEFLCPYCRLPQPIRELKRSKWQ